MENSESKAFWEGYAAPDESQHDKSKTNNPYKIGTREHEDWDRGARAFFFNEGETPEEDEYWQNF